MSPSRYLHLYNVVIRRTRRLKCMPLGRRVNVSPPPHYKNIGKHELEPSRDRDFSLSPTKNPRKFTTHTLFSDRVKNLPPPRPSSGLPRIYIFAPGHARLRSYFTRGRGNYTARAGVKGGSQFSNPFEQSVYVRFDGRTTKIGRRGKPSRGRARITLRCFRSAWFFNVRRIGSSEGGRKLWRVERHKNRVFSIGGGKRTVSHNEPSRGHGGEEGWVRENCNPPKHALRVLTGGVERMKRFLVRTGLILAGRVVRSRLNIPR